MWVTAAGYSIMQKLNEQQGQTLVTLARRSIGEYLKHRKHFEPSHALCDARLLEKQACFVTLHLQGDLRGCIGSLEPTEALIDNVAHNAWSAAFADPRFGPVSIDEFDALHIDVSVLGLAIPMDINSEESLLKALRPGQDGLILYTPQGGRATFLPSVWEQLPDPIEFVHHLKRKAGLPSDYWHPAMRAERYEVQYFEETR